MRYAIKMLGIQHLHYYVTTVPDSCGNFYILLSLCFESANKCHISENNISLVEVNPCLHQTNYSLSIYLTLRNLRDDGGMFRCHLQVGDTK